MTKLGFRGWLLWGEYDSQQFFKLKGKGSGFWIPGTLFQYLSVELGLWIPIMRGIPDSMSCIPVSKTHDSWFHIPKPRFTYMGQNTVCTSKGLQMKVVAVVVHPHLSSPRRTLPNPRRGTVDFKWRKWWNNFFCIWNIWFKNLFWVGKFGENFLGVASFKWKFFRMVIRGSACISWL